ncbi:MAG: response regulator [Bacteroidia bacterium]|nr:response regulator [Bacteroidia bacterium]
MKYNILIAEDEENYLHFLLNTLKDAPEDFSVISAPNGKVACELSTTVDPHIILMDWDMPEMSGIEAIRQIKANEKTKEIPILMVTALSDTERLTEAFEAGAIDYLIKPFNPTELLARIKSVLKTNLKTNEYHQTVLAQKEKLETLLGEKNILLREIHHRVKNNLQMISGLLQLQLAYVEDQKACGLITNCNDRILSMANIHENIYQTRDLNNINVQEFIDKTILNIIEFYKKTDSINYSVETNNINFNIDILIPLGFLLYEVVSNSAKHAFPEGQNGNINVELTQTDESNYQIKISDDGQGLNKEANLQNANTFGMKLIPAFVQELNGNYEVETEYGTCYLVDFKLVIRNSK